MKNLIMILIPLALSGCAAGQEKEGKTGSRQAEGGEGGDSLQKTANEACQQYGKEKATYVHSANMNPHLPKGSGVQNTIWKCE